MAAGATAQASAGGMAPVEVDEQLARRSFRALLDRGDAFFVQFITNEATLAGATAEQIERFALKASLGKNDRELLIELAPDLCRELGIDPHKFAVYIFAGVLSLHGLSLWQATRELREQRRELEAERRREQEDAPAATPKLTPAAANLGGA